MKSLLGKKLAQRVLGDAAAALPTDKLSRAALRESSELLVGHSGLPHSADSLAYEPVQRLLAVGCSDGRVKIIGRPGVEQTLFPSNSPGVPTQQLLFLVNRGVMLRVTQSGLIECWSIEHAASGHSRPLHVLRLASDTVVCIAALSKEPYLLMGCSSGSIRVATFISASGVAVTEARQVKGLKLLPFRVTPEELQASGEVAALSALSFGRQHFALSVHAGSGAAVWDIRGMRLAAAVNPSSDDTVTAVQNAGAVTSAAWASGLGKHPEFATGHENGDIFVWSLPTSSRASASSATEQPALQGVHRLAKRPASAVRRLEFVAGKLNSMLVLGGQTVDEPDALTVVPLQQSAPQGRQSRSSDSEDEGGAVEPRQPVKLPWLGHIVGHSMVPSKGSVAGFEEIAAVATLMDEGQLFVHNLENSKPVNVSPLFQTVAAEVKAACFIVATLPAARSAGHQAACTLRGLQQTAKQQQQEACTAEVALMLQGGQQPGPPDTASASVHCVGYHDGSVRLWDVSSDVTHLVATTPSAAAGAALKAAGEKPQPVTCLLFNADLGILVSGHERGGLRVQLFQDRGCKSTIAVMGSVAQAARSHEQTLTLTLTVQHEVAGFHLKAISKVHGADICCLAFAASSKLLAAADCTGVVSLTDISKPMVRWLQLATSQPIVSIALATAALPGPRDRAPGCTREMQAEGALIPAVYLAAADCSCGVLDAETGSMVGAGGWLRPKHPSQAVHMALLDAEGQPLWMSCAPPSMPSTPSASGVASPTGPISPPGSVSAPATTNRRSGSVTRSQADDDSDGEASGGGSTPRTPTSRDDDSDMEEYLAAAAAQMDAQGKRKNVIGGLIMKVKKKEPPPPPAPQSPKEKAEAPKVPDLQRSSSAAAPPSPPPRPSSPLAVPSSPPPPAAPRPVAREAHPAYCVMCTAEYLRVYSVGNVVGGERTTIKKVSAPCPILQAATFQADGAPGLICLALNGGVPHLLVYSLPGLDQLAVLSLEEAVPWLLASPADRWAANVAVGQGGEVLVLAANSELLRLAVAHSTRVPAPPASLYDWELAAAAHAANVALEKALARTPATSAPAMQQLGSGAAAEPSSSSGEAAAPSVPEPADKQPAGDGPKQRVGLHNVLSKVQQGVNAALNETTKGLQNFVHKVDADLSKLITREGEREAVHSAPELAVVFAAVVPEEDGSIEAEVSAYRSGGGRRPGPPAVRLPSIGDAAGEEDDEVASLGDDPPTPPPRRIVQSPSTRFSGSTPGSSSSSGLDKQRAELFGTASVPPPQLRVRTASEIKAAYGRSSSVSTGRPPEVGAVMAENREKLEERGERLRQLNERSAAMEAEAADFATMAKRLAEQQKNRKWWQL